MDDRSLEVPLSTTLASQPRTQLLEAELVHVEREGFVVVADGDGELGNALGHT